MRLKELRIENGFTQNEISDLMNVKRGTYSMWECGSDLIPLKRLNDFCNIVDVSIDYCLEFTYIYKYKNSSLNINIKKSSIRLKDARIENKLTQEEIGKKINVNRSLISKYEKGHALINTAFLIEYINLFNISGDYLLGRIDDRIYIKKKSKEKVKN